MSATPGFVAMKPPPAAGVPEAPDPPSSASLYVRGLSQKVTESQLYEFFSQAGSVVSVRVCKSASRKSLAYGYVNFQSVADAERALDTLSYTKLEGRPILIAWSRSNPSKRSHEGLTFIKNLDPSIDSLLLEEVFMDFGNIVSCEVQTDEETEESLGYGFVQFESDEVAKKAIEAMNGKYLNDKKIYMGPFIPRHMRIPVNSAENFTILFVKELASSTTEEQLMALFAPFGVITIADLFPNYGRPFGFVHFEKHEDAVRAVEDMNGKTVGDNTLYVARAQTKMERKQYLAERRERTKDCNLVENLSPNVDSQQFLRDLFDQIDKFAVSTGMRDQDGRRGAVPVPKKDAHEIAAGRLHKAVEIRKLKLHFLKSSEPEKIITHEFSPVTMVKEVVDVMCPLLGVEKEQVRVWDILQLLDMEKNLSQSTIIDNQYLMFEEKLESGEGPKHSAAGTIPSYSTCPTNQAATGIKNFTSIYLMHLNSDLNAEEVQKIVVKATTDIATVSRVWFATHPYTHGEGSCGFAIVNFESLRGAAQALELFQDTEQMSKVAVELLHPQLHLCAAPAGRKKQMKEWAYVYIGNLAKSLTPKRLEDDFRSYGEIVEVNILGNQNAGLDQCGGFMRFEKASDAIRVTSKDSFPLELYVALMQLQEPGLQQSDADPATQSSYPSHVLPRPMIPAGTRMPHGATLDLSPLDGHVPQLDSELDEHLQEIIDASPHDHGTPTLGRGF